VELALLDGLNRATAWASANTDAVAKRVIDTVWTLGGAVASGALSVFTFTFGLFLTGFFFFFISSSFPDVKRFFEGLIPDDKRERTIDLAQKMDAVIAGFVRGRLTIMLIQSVFFTIGYWAIGAPASLLLGVGVGILSVVPYLALIGVPVSITLMALNSDMEGFRAAWWWVVFAPIGVYWVGQALDDYVLTPLIQGKSTDLDTPTVLFASIAGGILGGFYGLLIAIPLAACLKILIRELVWPRFRAWVAGENADPLPLGDAGRDA
jgi:predicted PurR-regulated permease PerM